MRTRIVLLPAVLLLLAAGGAAQTPAAPPAEPEGWESLVFLLGEWDGIGAGAPGRTAGSFSLQPDLDGNILVRHNAVDTPEGSHEDLMIVYHAAPGVVQAIYFDDEGHVIDYDLEPPPGPGVATFVSEAPLDQPRYRLSYRLNDDRTVTVTFAIAPPGTADFQTYLEGTARRRPASADR